MGHKKQNVTIVDYIYTICYIKIQVIHDFEQFHPLSEPNNFNNRQKEKKNSYKCFHYTEKKGEIISIYAIN